MVYILFQAQAYTWLSKLLDFDLLLRPGYIKTCCTPVIRKAAQMQVIGHKHLYGLVNSQTLISCWEPWYMRKCCTSSNKESSLDASCQAQASPAWLDKLLDLDFLLRTPGYTQDVLHFSNKESSVDASHWAQASAWLGKQPNFDFLLRTTVYEDI